MLLYSRFKIVGMSLVLFSSTEPESLLKSLLSKGTTIRSLNKNSSKSKNICVCSVYFLVKNPLSFLFVRKFHLLVEHQLCDPA